MQCLTIVNIWYVNFSSCLLLRLIIIHFTWIRKWKFLTFNSYFCQNTNGVARLEEQSTATYCVVIDESGEMSLGLGDMDIHQQITEQYVSSAGKSEASLYIFKFWLVWKVVQVLGTLCQVIVLCNHTGLLRGGSSSAKCSLLVKCLNSRLIDNKNDC